MSALKLLPLVESILKESSSRCGGLREGVGGLPDGFVIGPDAKYIPIVGNIFYHGRALDKYPSLRKKAVSEVGARYDFDDVGLTPEQGLVSAQENGATELYSFMYNHGFIRGGSRGSGMWVAMIPSKASYESKLMVVKLAKEHNINSIDVDAQSVFGYERGFSRDEFVEKFL